MALRSVVPTMNVRDRMRNRVQVIAVLLVVDVRLGVGNVVRVRFRMQMAAGLIAGAVRLIRLGVSLANAVSVDHSTLLLVGLLRVRLALSVLLLWVLPLNHRTS